MIYNIITGKGNPSTTKGESKVAKKKRKNTKTGKVDMATILLTGLVDLIVGAIITLLAKLFE